jgi:hypothetical protein
MGGGLSVSGVGLSGGNNAGMSVNLEKNGGVASQILRGI